jgi:hypothetical protein
MLLARRPPIVAAQAQLGDGDQQSQSQAKAANGAQPTTALVFRHDPHSFRQTGNGADSSRKAIAIIVVFNNEVTLAMR